ncbi:MAG: SOS response-associated peptidase [Betaproteobacteria bacterium]|nr:SOS response-associated peptidase [Betaproteobacteria bacterium]
MCINFTPTRQTEWATRTLGVGWPQGHPPEAFPGYEAPIVVRSHQQGRQVAGQARFGLVPPWAKDVTFGRHTVNARSETAASKPSFRNAWQARQFALLLVDRFFEPCYESGRSVRWSIAAHDGLPLGLPCLWERWRDGATGATVVSFAMLTVHAGAHPLMQRFHKSGEEKRAPVMLPTSLWDEWLAATPTAATELLDLKWAPPLVGHSDPLPPRGRKTVTA